MKKNVIRKLLADGSSHNQNSQVYCKIIETQKEQLRQSQEAEEITKLAQALVWTSRKIDSAFSCSTKPFDPDLINNISTECEMTQSSNLQPPSLAVIPTKQLTLPPPPTAFRETIPSRRDDSKTRAKNLDAAPSITSMATEPIIQQYDFCRQGCINKESFDLTSYPLRSGTSEPLITRYTGKKSEPNKPTKQETLPYFPSCAGDQARLDQQVGFSTPWKPPWLTQAGDTGQSEQNDSTDKFTETKFKSTDNEDKEKTTTNATQVSPPSASKTSQTLGDYDPSRINFDNAYQELSDCPLPSLPLMTLPPLDEMPKFVFEDETSMRKRTEKAVTGTEGEKTISKKPLYLNDDTQSDESCKTTTISKYSTISSESEDACEDMEEAELSAGDDNKDDKKMLNAFNSFDMNSSSNCLEGGGTTSFETLLNGLNQVVKRMDKIEAQQKLTILMKESLASKSKSCSGNQRPAEDSRICKIKAKSKTSLPDKAIIDGIDTTTTLPFVESATFYQTSSPNSLDVKDEEEDIQPQKIPENPPKISRRVKSSTLLDRSPVYPPTKPVDILDAPQYNTKNAHMCLSSPDWTENVKGFRILVRLARHHPDELYQDLGSLVWLGQLLLKSHKSTLCRYAIACFTELFNHMGAAMDSESEKIGDKLLRKYMDTNKFIRLECDRALTSMVQQCSADKVLHCIDVHGRKHKHKLVRYMSAKLCVVFIRTVSVEVALADHSDTLLPMVLSFLLEPSKDVRGEARNALNLLVQHECFDFMLRRCVPGNMLRAAADKIRSIKESLPEFLPKKQHS